MAAANQPMKAQGTTLSYTKEGAEKKAVGNLNSIGELSQTSEEIDVTTLDAEGAYRKYIPGFKDAGQLQLGGFFTPGNASQDELNDLYQEGETCSWEIAFNDGSTVTFNAFVMGIAIGPVEVNGSPNFSATLRVTGPITITPAAA